MVQYSACTLNLPISSFKCRLVQPALEKSKPNRSTPGSAQPEIIWDLKLSLATMLMNHEFNLVGQEMRPYGTMVSSRGRKRAFLTARKWIHFEKSLIFLSGSCEDDHIGQRIFVYKIKERIPIVKARPSVSGCVLNVKTNILILKRKKDISDRKERRGPCKYSCRDFSDLTTSLRTLRPQYTNKAQSWLSGRGVALQKP